MAEDNLEAARGIIEAMNDHDVDAVVALATPDCVIVALRSAIEGAFEGHAGVRRWIETYVEAIPDVRFEVERLRAVDDHRVVLLGRQAGTASLGGAPFDEPMAGIGEFEGGLLKRWEAYPSHAEALAAAGLS